MFWAILVISVMVPYLAMTVGVSVPVTRKLVTRRHEQSYCHVEPERAFRDDSYVRVELSKWNCKRFHQADCWRTDSLPLSEPTSEEIWRALAKSLLWPMLLLEEAVRKAAMRGYPHQPLSTKSIEELEREAGIEP